MPKIITDNDYFVLTALVPDPLHGYQIVKEIDRRTDGEKKLSLASLYDTIRKLEQSGLIQLVGEPEVVDGRARKTYEITASGGDAIVSKERLLLQMQAASTHKPLSQNFASHGEAT